MKRHPVAAWAAVVFISIFCGLLWLHGNRIVMSNDEGIILDAATRMLHGQAPYRDFFTYMSPGSYWLQEAAFAIFGVSLRAGRVPVIFDFALECALLFWLTARLAGRKAAGAVLFLFFAIQATTPEFLLAQHRMDSAGLSLASIALCLEGRMRAKWGYWASGGLAIAAAAICTPTIALIAAATLIWLIAEPPLRRFLLPYGCGLGAGAAAIVTALAASGILIPFLKQMLWLGRNYTELNVMPYGWIIGGYGTALAGATGTDLIIRPLLVFSVALPAVAPVVALLGWGAAMLADPAKRRWAANKAIPYLLASMVLYVASTYPRADVAHLAFVGALPAVLVAVWLARCAPSWLANSIFGVLAVSAGMFLAQTAAELRHEVAVSTPVGALQVRDSDAPALRALLAAVHPGDALYTHPYRPLLYFLTKAQNPTRYSYLGPGLMTAADEQIALAALENSPPKWLLYLPLSREEFLRVFPHATKLDHRFPAIEAWSRREYDAVNPAVIVGGYRLYERRAGSATPSLAARAF